MNNLAIKVSELSKTFQIYKKEPGITGSLKSIFNRKYVDIKAVNNISFGIEESELIGFIGPNGAGKTTTLKMLSGIMHPSSGDVSTLGYVPLERKNAYIV